MNESVTWKLLRKVAHRGYLDGIDTLACIEVLEGGNRSEIIQCILDAGAGDAADLIRKSLFARVHMNVMRAYDPVRTGDHHLHVAIRLLKKPGALNQAPTADQRYNLEEAIRLWDEAVNDPRLRTLRHLRNKFVAHLSAPDDDIPVPKIRELFGFAKQTCMIWEQLSFGTAVVMIKLDNQVEAYADSARAFWDPWQSRAADH